ncbi:MAG: hypothetical protein CMH63_02660 [Nanoarchaeota archaeon]|jgi:hypothetical protein|nr:hypothetical protein [Nanoarchaeota archaeon]|tara:strand:+ start:11426 stop:11854 length:429 start_codon:yes stop_codon:yes gene_type:complete
MENKILMWAIVMIFAISILFNTGDLTGEATKDLGPILTISNTLVSAGSTLNVNVRNLQSTSNEFYILNENGRYTGQRFFSRTSRCEKVSGKNYECNPQYRVPMSLLPYGDYYIQVKDRKGRLVGNKAYFTIMGSKYVGSGRS